MAVYAPSANAFYDRERVSPEAGGGGAEFQTTQLTAGLAKAGLRTAHIVYPVGERIDLPPRVDLVEREPYRGKGGPAAKLKEARAIWRALALADADVCLLRGYGLHLIVAALFARLRRRSTLLSGSNDIDFMPEQRARSRIGARVYRWAIGSSDLIVAQTRQQLEIARANFPRSRVETIPSFAEPAGLSRLEPEAFLWAGRLVPYKRPIKYLELAEELPDARFWMVGVETSETPKELSEEVRRRAARLGNVELLDPRPRSELLTLIERSIAVVLTSEYEGMPNVFMEAWMRGVPVATLSFDPDGRVGDKGIGVAAEGDWGAFVRGVRGLAEQRGSRAEMGRRGREYAIETHAPTAVARLWASAVERV